MRMFYIFNLKKEIKELYSKSPSDLFRVLNNIYYMHEEYANYGFNILNQIINKNDINDLNKNIFVDMHKECVYTKNKNEHIINDLYNNEVSILKIKKSHLVLQSNMSYSSFFKLLLKYSDCYFVCDFLEKDFFFITSINKLVKE